MTAATTNPFARLNGIVRPASEPEPEPRPVSRNPFAAASTPTVRYTPDSTGEFPLTPMPERADPVADRAKTITSEELTDFRGRFPDFKGDDEQARRMAAEREIHPGGVMREPAPPTFGENFAGGFGAAVQRGAPRIAGWIGADDLGPKGGVGGFLGTAAGSLVDPSNLNAMRIPAAGSAAIARGVAARFAPYIGKLASRSIGGAIGGAGGAYPLEIAVKMGQVSEAEMKEDPWGALVRVLTPGPMTAAGGVIGAAVGPVAARGMHAAPEAPAATTPRPSPEVAPEPVQPVETPPLAAERTADGVQDLKAEESGPGLQTQPERDAVQVPTVEEVGVQRALSPDEVTARPSPEADVPAGAVERIDVVDDAAPTPGRGVDRLEGVKVEEVNPVAQEAPPVPPSVGEVASVEPPAKRLTSARKDWTAQDREVMGLDELPSPESRSWAEAVQTARDRGLSDSTRAQRTAAEVNAKPRALDDIETAGMVDAMTTLKNEHARVMDKIGKSTDPADAASLSAEAGRIESEFDLLTQAVRKSGTEKGRALASQKITLDQDYSLVAVKARAKAAKGKELTAKESAQLAETTAKLEETTKRVADLERQVADQAADRAIRRHRGVARSAATREADIVALTAKAKALLKAGC